MNRLEGEVEVEVDSGGIAYIPQTAWLQHASIRDNM
jgi:hypothetical protein